MLLFIDNC